jgi:uncharacterized phage protein (TIGR02218 family)
VPRTVDPDLQALLDTRRHALSWALRIQPHRDPGNAFGLCGTNVDQTFDDGQGAITYVAAYGFEPSALAATSGQGVDNAEARAIFGVPDIANAFGITVQMVDSGYLDAAKWHLYIFDTESDDKRVLAGYGLLGEVRYENRRLVIPELQSLSQVARQKAVCEPGSKTCRAEYGDASTGCPAVFVWSNASVSSVSSEADRVFSTAATVPVPGMIEWLTGANAGRSSKVESYAAGVVGLRHPTPYPITNTDTYRHRDHCDKQWATCKALLGSLAVTHFRGEPYRQESIGDALQTPGATTR